MVRKNRVKQCLTRGVFSAGPSPGAPRGANPPAPAAAPTAASAPALSFDDQCRIAAELGVHGFDLIGFNDWPTLKKYGLKPTMGPPAGVGIPNGINSKENHDKIEAAMRPAIDQCAAGGCPNLITVSGSKRMLSDEEGWDACVSLLNRVKAQAEDKGVTIALELLNSKIGPSGPAVQSHRLGAWKSASG